MRDRWPKSVAALHWLSAALLVGLAGAGFVMTDLPNDSSTRLLLSRLHTVGGLTLMLLTVARIVVRARAQAPGALPLTKLHRRGIGVVHVLLYVTIIGIGASGFLTGLRSEWPSYLGGVVTRAPALEALATREIHESLVFTLIGLVLLHVGGVAVQQVRHRNVLRRMVPFWK